jgi:hypothetical protein
MTITYGDDDKLSVTFNFRAVRIIFLFRKLSFVDFYNFIKSIFSCLTVISLRALLNDFDDDDDVDDQIETF